LISYSAYLWHQPLFAFARHRSSTEPGHIIFFVLSLIALVLAYFSWRYVEAPFRNKDKFKRSLIFSLSAFGSFFFITFGSIIHFNFKSYEEFWKNKLPDNQKLFYEAISFSSNIDSRKGFYDLSECRFNTDKLTPTLVDRIKQCHLSNGSGILILGDSHAIDLYGATSSKFSDKFLVGITSSGCRPHTPLADCQYNDVYDFIKNNQLVFRHVIYEQAGFYLLLDTNRRKGTRTMFSSLPYDAYVDNFVPDIDHINGTLHYLSDISKIVPVTWLLPRIEHHISFNFLLKNGCEFNFVLRPNMVEVFLMLERSISNLVTESGLINLKVISQNSIFNFIFPEDLLSCNEIYWRDGDHFSSSGEKRFGSRLPNNFLKF